jgi:HEPN domain-containing protein
MHDLARDLAREWLTRAEHDLRVARYLLTMPDPPPESIGFHAQQCAEKAFKGNAAKVTMRCRAAAMPASVALAV